MSKDDLIKFEKFKELIYEYSEIINNYYKDFPFFKKITEKSQEALIQSELFKRKHHKLMKTASHIVIESCKALEIEFGRLFSNFKDKMNKSQMTFQNENQKITGPFSKIR